MATPRVTPPGYVHPHHPHVPSVHLNLNGRGLSSSASLATNERAAALVREGREIFNLGLGQSPFPVPEPVVEALRDNAHRKEYLAVRGLAALREAVAAYHHRRHRIVRHPEHVLIGPGSKELMFLLQLVYYGDLVIPTPCWVSYAPQARIIGRPVRWIDTTAANDWHMRSDDLERLCETDPERPRLVVLNYPNNPTGHTYGPDELRRLAAVARRYRVVLLADEIYGELHHAGTHVSIAEFYPEGTIISTGLSKWCGAGGWRLGTFTFPRSLDWLLEAMAVVASETYTATSTPIQFAAVTAFAGTRRLITISCSAGGCCARSDATVRRRCGSPASRSWRPRGPSICFLIFNRAERPCEPRASAQVWSSASGCSRTRAWPPSQGPAADGPRPSSRSAWRTSISTGRTSWLRPRHSVRTGRWTKSFSSATAPG